MPAFTGVCRESTTAQDPGRVLSFAARQAMPTPARSASSVRFGDYELQIDAGELRKSGGHRVALPEQPLRSSRGSPRTSRRPRLARAAARATVDGGHVCRFRAWVERRREAVAGRTRRLGGGAPIHRDGPEARLPFHRPGAARHSHQSRRIRLCPGSAPEHPGKGRGRDVAL